jgi:hypothetical protein
VLGKTERDVPGSSGWAGAKSLDSQARDRRERHRPGRDVRSGEVRPDLAGSRSQMEVRRRDVRLPVRMQVERQDLALVLVQEGVLLRDDRDLPGIGRVRILAPVQA